MPRPRSAVHHGSPPQIQQPLSSSIEHPVRNSEDASPDSLTSLLQSLMIGNPAPAERRSEPELEPILNPNTQPGSDPRLEPQPERSPTPDMETCARCKASGRTSAVLSCCMSKICLLCLEDALNARVQNDLWHSFGSPQWIGCLANSCRVYRDPSEVLHDLRQTSQSNIRGLSLAVHARKSMESIRPRPSLGECDLARRLHNTLTEHQLMSRWTDTEGEVVSGKVFPVRSGFSIQSVPILTSMLRLEPRTCPECSGAFRAVDTASNTAAWNSIFNAFPGDWTWMILGRPTKSMLPECGEKHSLDVCPSCLPKVMFSGLEFMDAMAGSGGYRFICPVCKHVFSSVQVERIARLIAPSRAAVNFNFIGLNTKLGTPADPTTPQNNPSPFGPSHTSLRFGAPSNRRESDEEKLKESLMDAIVSKKPNVKWDDVAGLTPAKHELQRAIVFPSRFPSLYDEKRKASGAILLYGPPGTGKSYLAKAVATEVDHTLFSISSADVVGKYMGESEKLIRHLFTLARSHKPSIIFIDEIDALCASRDSGGSSSSSSEHTSRLKTELLVQVDGLATSSSSPSSSPTPSASNDDKSNTGVVVLAATNLPWLLDPAFRRRFEPRIYIPLPDAQARRELFRIHAGKWGREVLGERDLDELACLTEGYSGSDIANVVRSALGAPLGRVQRAKFFRVVNTEKLDLGMKAGQAREEGMYYTPCEAYEKGAVEMTWEQVPRDRLLEPRVTAEDFRVVVRERRVKSSVGAGELRKYEEWTREFGVEGSGGNS
ncbi:hypothetical protein VTI74DRAFT_5426 [Chaetomium olivicolor]